GNVRNRTQVGDPAAIDGLVDLAGAELRLSSLQRRFNIRKFHSYNGLRHTHIIPCGARDPLRYNEVVCANGRTDPARLSGRHCRTAFGSSRSGCRTSAAFQLGSGSEPAPAKSILERPASLTSSNTWCSKEPRIALRKRSPGQWIPSVAGWT